MSLDRFSLNIATVRYASLEEAVKATVDAGLSSIGLWREPVQEYGLEKSVRLLKDEGLRVSGICRAGLFTGSGELFDAKVGMDARGMMENNYRAIDEAKELETESLVLVVGGLPTGSRDIVGAREMVAESLDKMVEYSRQAGVKLGIEPLHPMYTSDRSVVSTLKQALDLAEKYTADEVGVVLDTFHLWWDPELEEQIARAGRGNRIYSYQVCDFLTPIVAGGLLTRGYPGDGPVDFKYFTELVRDAGYTGDIEVEIFNQDVWDTDYTEATKIAAARYEELVVPYL